jgi:hypothetical protein
MTTQHGARWQRLRVYRRSVSVPLTGALQMVPVYVTVIVDAVSGTAVPPRTNGHVAAVPAVFQLSVVPVTVPAPVPDTGTPAQVALKPIAPVDAPVGVTEYVMPLQTPTDAAVDHVPEKGVMGVVVIGAVGVAARSSPHAERKIARTIATNMWRDMDAIVQGKGQRAEEGRGGVSYCPASRTHSRRFAASVASSSVVT